MTQDGGWAFPTNTLSVPLADANNPKYMGMTLRNYFAAKAMQSLLASDRPVSISPSFFAKEAELAYLVADTILVAGKLEVARDQIPVTVMTAAYTGIE